MEVFFIIIYLFIYKARVIIRVFDTFVTGYLFNSSFWINRFYTTLNI